MESQENQELRSGQETGAQNATNELHIGAVDRDEQSLNSQTDIDMDLHTKELDTFEFDRGNRGIVPQSDPQLDHAHLASDLLEDELRSDEPYMNPTSELHSMNLR